RLTFFDLTDTVTWSTGGAQLDCGQVNTELCMIGSGATPAVVQDLFFNIYSPDGTLSDTLEVNAKATTGITSTFLSDTSGVVLVPYPVATSITEDGTVQEAASILLNDGVTHFIVQFQSDITDASAVPEPRWYGVILTLGV